MNRPYQNLTVLPVLYVLYGQFMNYPYGFQPQAIQSPRLKSLRRI